MGRTSKKIKRYQEINRSITETFDTLGFEAIGVECAKIGLKFCFHCGDYHSFGDGCFDRCGDRASYANSLYF